MTRNTKPLSGGGKDKFLRGIVASVEGVPETAAKALVRELTTGIAEVRVRREAYDRVRDGATDVAAPPARAQASAVTASRAAAFDPFAFSVVAILTKKGKPALVVELEKVTSVDDLRRLADAQHVSLDPALTDPAVMRSAIIEGAERRIAERKAAAS